MALVVDDFGLEGLPLQKQLVVSCIEAFEGEPDVLAAVLLGSLAKGTGDRVSDADVVVFTCNGYHKRADSAYARFVSNKPVFYTLKGDHNDNACFRKYLFEDMTSAEIHCIDISEPFELSKPFTPLFDKSSIIESRLTDKPAPMHENFPVYTSGDEGLIWELFDCIKWLSRGNKELAKDYLKRLSEKL